MRDFQDMLMVCTALHSLNEQLIRDRKCSTISDPKKGQYESKKGDIVGAIARE